MIMDGKKLSSMSNNNQLKKLENRLRDQLEHKKTAIQSNIAKVPRLLMLEVNNACNLKCVMCYNPDMIRSKGTMPLEMGLRAINEAADMGIKEVTFYTVGEPLIYRHLETLIKEAKRLNLYCYLTSNGLLLNQETSEMFCEQGLDSFKFSIDGANKDEYEAIRVNGNFDKLLEKVKLLKDTRDRMGSNLKIICATVLTELNKNSTEDFKKLFGPLSDEIFVSEMTNQGGKMDLNSIKEFGDQEFSPCRILWDRIVICYDGKITACCIDFDAELTYDDYNKTSLSEAWNNQVIMKWRELHMKKDVNDIPLCKDCTLPYTSDIDIFD